MGAAAGAPKGSSKPAVEDVGAVDAAGPKGLNEFVLTGADGLSACGAAAVSPVALLSSASQEAASCGLASSSGSCEAFDGVVVLLPNMPKNRPPVALALGSFFSAEFTLAAAVALDVGLCFAVASASLVAADLLLSDPKGLPPLPPPKKLANGFPDLAAGSLLLTEVLAGADDVDAGGFSVGDGAAAASHASSDLAFVTAEVAFTGVLALRMDDTASASSA